MSVSEAAMLELCPLAERYLDDVLAIEVEAYPEPWSVGMFRQEIRNPLSHFYVALLDDVLVGYAGFWLVLDEAHITSVAVHKEYRRRGFGRRMILRLLRVAVDLDARRAMLEVRESNHAAHTLYTELGFRVVGLRRGYYPKTRENAIVMMLEMGPQWSITGLSEEDEGFRGIRA